MKLHFDHTEVYGLIDFEIIYEQESVFEIWSLRQISDGWGNFLGDHCYHWIQFLCFSYKYN